jgi:hypothetical protein
VTYKTLLALGSLLVVSGGSGIAGAETAEGDPALVALVKTLHDSGVLDEEQYTEISAKAAATAAKEETPGWWNRMTIWGDFRARYEGFFYKRDPDGERSDDQQRGRYRFRLGLATEINDYARVIFQLATGAGDNRSANQTFGGNLDFGKDLIEVDLAYLELTPFPTDGQLPLDSEFKVDVGRMPNAFLWKNGRDVMLWDNDINPSGVDFRLTSRPADAVDVFATTAYFIDDENSGSKDPSIFAAQLGANARASDTFTFGGRVSFFQFHSLDEAFVERAANSTNGPSVTTGGGNILDGLTGSASGGEAGVLATAVYLRCAHFEAWPITAYGSFSNNMSAESSDLFPAADKESVAWAVGLELGDKKRYAQIGTAYVHLEANAFPSMFVESDLFDGRTNREGWVVYGARELFKNTDLNLTAFLGDAIEDDLPTYEDSVPGAHRLRLQADVTVKF